MTKMANTTKKKAADMHHLDKSELRRLFQVAYDRTHDRKLNRSGVNWHLALLCMVFHGARVSEITDLRGTDIDVVRGTLTDRRLKGSDTTEQPIRVDSDVLFDQSPIIALAIEKKGDRLFPVTRQSFNWFINECGKDAGLNLDKCHPHALKHSAAMICFSATGSLSQVQKYLGHRSIQSTLIYLNETDKTKAFAAMAAVTF
jgi:integrase/recombinase XerD